MFCLVVWPPHENGSRFKVQLRFSLLGDAFPESCGNYSGVFFLSYGNHRAYICLNFCDRHAASCRQTDHSSTMNCYLILTDELRVTQLKRPYEADVINTCLKERLPKLSDLSGITQPGSGGAPTHGAGRSLSGGLSHCPLRLPSSPSTASTQPPCKVPRRAAE